MVVGEGSIAGGGRGGSEEETETWYCLKEM